MKKFSEYLLNENQEIIISTDDDLNYKKIVKKFKNVAFELENQLLSMKKKYPDNSKKITLIYQNLRNLQNALFYIGTHKEI